MGSPLLNKITMKSIILSVLLTEKANQLDNSSISNIIDNNIDIDFSILIKKTIFK